MIQPAPHTVRLQISPRAAGLVGPGASRDAQLAAARGALPLTGTDLLTVLYVLCASPDAEVKQAALHTVRTLPAADLLPAPADPALPPALLDLLVRLRLSDAGLMARVINHPVVSDATLCYLGARAGLPVLERLADQRHRLTAAIAAAIAANPHADPQLKSRLGRGEDAPPPAPVAADSPGDQGDEELESFPAAVDGDPDAVEEVSDAALAARLREAEEQGMSKYQLVAELKVAEKIKLAMTGDREWRKLLIKDPNKMVHGAVLKNGRITEAEVIMVARNKSASDEMVRLILLNREWMKNYEIRKALVTHPKTPLPKALRFIGDLTLRDLKEVMRNRNISSAIAGSARREVERKAKRGG